MSTTNITCDKGFIVNSSGTACVKCLDGTYQPFDNSTRTQCDPCPPGYTSSSDNSQCDKCPSGTYNDVMGGDCQPCADGTYSDSTNSTIVCSQCDPGYTSNSTKTGCDKCPSGTYNDVTGGTCRPCADGTYSDSTINTTVCSKCDPGYTSNSTKTGCIPCPIGTYNNVTGGTCRPCPDGTYNSMISANNCLKCQLGYIPNSTKTGCDKCLNGTYNDGTTTTCIPCRDGTIQDGTISSSACISCLPGQESNQDHTSCIKCLNGTYNDVKGEMCKTCPNGTFQDGSSVYPTYCQNCLSGEESIPDRTSCVSVTSVKCCSETQTQGCGTNIPNSSQCDTILNKYCQDENLNTPECLNYCKNNPLICKEKITAFCVDKLNKKDPNTSKSYSELCGCYYPNDIYQNYLKSVEQKFNIPPTSFDNNRQCYFPECQTAVVQPKTDYKCPSSNLCIVNTTLSNTGSIIKGNVDTSINCNAPTPASQLKPSTKTDTPFIKTTPGIVTISISGIVVLVGMIFLIKFLISRKKK